MTRSADDVSALLAQHGQQLFALLVRLTLRYDVAEDLLQELFCKLAASNGFQRAENPLAYAHRAATNLALDWRRSKKQQIKTDAQCDGIAAKQNSPLTDLIRREQLDQVLNTIATLSSPGREIVVLRYLEQQSYESIASGLGKTTHQVRALCFKAIKKLRSVLEKSDRASQPTQNANRDEQQTRTEIEPNAEGVPYQSPGSPAAGAPWVDRP